MAKRYVTNDTPNMMYVAGMMIAPGEGREVEVAEDALPEVEEVVADPDEPLRDLLKGTVAGVTAALDGLSADTLTRLQVLEAEGEKPRKGVMEALGNALIALADAKLTSDDLGAGADAGLDAGAVAGADAGAVGQDTPPAQ